MLRNYFLTAIRSFGRNKVVTVLNLIGLSLGLASFALLVLYVFLESSFNSGYKHSERIYRVSINILNEGKIQKLAWSDSRLPELIKEIPEVESSTYLSSISSREIVVQVENQKFKESNFQFAGKEFFNVLSHDFIFGTKDEAMSNPFSIVLTKKINDKYFGGIDSRGKSLQIESKSYNVSAVIANHPYNTDIQFDAILTLENMQSDWCFTYVLASQTSTLEAIEAKLFSLFNERVRPLLLESNSDGSYSVEPITQTHLGPSRLYDKEKNSPTNLILLSTVSLFILLITSINYTNFTLALSANRFREVGLRQVLGATAKMIRTQFLIETMIIILVGLFAGFLILILGADTISGFVGVDIRTIQLPSLPIFLSLVLFVLLISVFASSYPSFYLSKTQSVQNLKGESLRIGGVRLRSVLMLFQLTISMGLIAWSAIADGQLTLVMDRTPWIQKENVLIIELPSEDNISSDAFKNSIDQLSVVRKSSLIGVSSIPVDDFGSEVYELKKNSEQTEEIISQLFVDENYLDALGIQLVEGRSFRSHHSGDSVNFVMVNEAFRAHYFSGNPVNESLTYQGEEFLIIGVVNDFNKRGINEEIKPLVIHSLQEAPAQLVIKMNESGPEALRAIARVWKTSFSKVPFDYTFLADKYSFVLKREWTTQNLVHVASIISIILSFLGIFGVVELDINKQAKQLAIRSLYGASLADLLRHTSRSYLILILIAGLIMTPVLIIAAQSWLTRFSTQITLGFHYFLSPVVGSTILVTFVILYNLIRILKDNLNEKLRGI